MLIRHGSEDSLDQDMYLVIKQPILNLQDCKKLCETFSKYNINLIVIENGQVVWCYKGTIDECNNSILATYSLHSENIEPCPITNSLQRDVDLKVQRTIRGLLTYCSRTKNRSSIKEALRSDCIKTKVQALSTIHLEDIKDFNKKQELKDVYKFFAFQLIQTIALLENQTEIFTKTTAANYISGLKPYLYRQVSNCSETEVLQVYWDYFLELVRKHYEL